MGNSIKPGSKPMVSAILKSTAAAAIVTIMLSVLVAAAINYEWMDFDKTGYASMAILLISGFQCGRAGKWNESPFAGAVSAALYLLLLLMVNALFFGGEFHGIGVTGIILALGTAMGMIRRGKKSGGRGRYKILIR